jgi:hypothetical protein
MTMDFFLISSGLDIHVVDISRACLRKHLLTPEGIGDMMSVD